MLRGEMSQGMVLAASDLKDGAAPAGDTKPGADERDVVVVTVAKPVKSGSKVS
jgi:tRNA-binding EMAP/Myf-like protein